MPDFIPSSDDALNTWLSNFKTKLGTYAATLKVSADDLTIYQNQCDALTKTILDVNDFRRQLKNKVDVKDEQRSDVVGNLRTLIARIKTEPNYTQAIGNDLGIITAATTVDLSTAKPVLTVIATGGQITVAFKRGQSNGIKIYSKRGGETAFSFLALDTHSPYHDTRENLAAGTPETRQYYAFYIDDSDAQVGLQSDTVSVTV